MNKVRSGCACGAGDWSRVSAESIFSTRFCCLFLGVFCGRVVCVKECVAVMFGVVGLVGGWEKNRGWGGWCDDGVTVRGLFGVEQGLRCGQELVGKFIVGLKWGSLLWCFGFVGGFCLRKGRCGVVFGGGVFVLMWGLLWMWGMCLDEGIGWCLLSEMWGSSLWWWFCCGGFNLRIWWGAVEVEIWVKRLGCTVGSSLFEGFGVCLWV